MPHRPRHVHQRHLFAASAAATALAVFLDLWRRTWQVVTEDSDSLAFGCKRVLFKLDPDGNGLEVVVAPAPSAPGAVAPLRAQCCHIGTASEPRGDRGAFLRQLEPRHGSSASAPFPHPLHTGR